MTRSYTAETSSGGRLSEQSDSLTVANRPASESYRLVAKQWVELEGAASLLEETKSAVLAQRMKALGDVPVSHAEREVKASPEWADFIKKMVDARTAANLAKVRMEFVRMRAMEHQSENANRRAEMRLTGVSA